MAEAFFNQLSEGKALAISAGTTPSQNINPTVISLMKEVSLDISQKKPKFLTMEMLDQVDHVITMGCNIGEVCPTGLVIIKDWQIEDPKGKPIAIVRQIRNEIRDKVESLLLDLKL
jgi:arsenate reductase